VTFSRLCILVLFLVATLAGGSPVLAQTDQIRSAQQRLSELGFNPGPIDGLMGARTHQALTAFQNQRGLPATGELDTRTLRALAARPAPAATSAAPSTAKSVHGDDTDGSTLWWWITGGLFLFLFWRFRASRRAHATTNTSASWSSEPAVKSERAVPRADPDLDDDLEGISIRVTMTPSPPQTLANAQNGDPYWVPARKSAMVKGLDIGGMVYVGRGLHRSAYGDAENCLIDPSLPIATGSPDIRGERLPYWPSYSRIPPTSRLAYLRWLASGRKDPDFAVGYVFLYFYGLERRLFLDRLPPEERLALIAEVERLRSIYAANGSFNRYSLALLEAAALLAPDAMGPSPVFTSASYEMPLPVQIGLGKRVAAGEPLDADWLLSWWITHPETRVRTPVRRAFPEFQELFRLKFARTYPAGLRVSPPRRTLRYVYRAASGSFERNFSRELSGWPDVSKLTKPVSIADQIAEECTSELDAFSRYLGRNPNGRNTVEGHALLPAALAARLPNAELDELRAWAEARIDRDEGLVPVEALLERLERQRPDRVSRRSLASAAAALSHIAIGFAPDPNFALRLPRNGEPIQLFRMHAGGGQLASPSDTFRNALFAATLGTFIAHADGTVSEAERQHLIAHIDRWDGLSDAERERLRANIDWMSAVPPNLTPLRKRFAEISEERKHAFSQLVIAVAGSDGRINPAEINAVRKLYKALGLPEDGIYSDLHALAANGGTSEPVTVRKPAAAPIEYAIPTAPEKRGGTAQAIRLDHDLVSAIMADTAKVSKVLGAIFADDEPEETESDDEAAAADSSLLRDLDPAHRALVAELVTRPTWSSEEFAQLATHFGLMPEGARETVNEWAFEQFDEALIEEEIDLEVNPAVAGALKGELGGKASGTAYHQTA